MQLPTFRILRPDVSVYLFYAGRDRKYMALSRAQDRAFLDLPGFLASEDTFESDATIIQALYRADATKRYLRDPLNFPRPREVSSYPTSVPTIAGKLDRSFVADLGNVRTMFVEMLEGDIVIMTPYNHYDPLLIGEVTGPWNESQMMTFPDQGNQPSPYRTIRWLSHGLSRRDFPAAVARRMQNRKAITKIDSTFYEPIFKLVYHAYLWGNTSKLDIFAPLYNSNDPTATAEASFLVKYAVAFYAAYEKGETDQFHAMDLDMAADLYFDPALVEQIAQAFGSPGGYIARLIGSGAAVAVAIILAVALSDEAQPIDHVQQQVANQVHATYSNPSREPQPDLSGLTNSLRAGKSEELRRKYGRNARAKLGLTLEGQVSPQVTARDRIRDGN